MIVFGGLLLLSLMLEGIAEKLKLPGMLLVLILGLLFPDFLGDNQTLITLDQAQGISSLGLVVILFYGGMTSRWEVMRKVIWSTDISEEMKPTGSDEFRAKLTAAAVLPMLGRAARMIKSPACRPEVMRSKSTNPVGTPVISF